MKIYTVLHFELECGLNQFTEIGIQIMLVKTCLSLFLCISLQHTIFPAAVEEIALDQEVQTIVDRTQQFIATGYIDGADTLARLTTTALLTPTRVASDAEIVEMVNAHLHTELYYAFNTKWGPNKARKHRIVYDFLSGLSKAVRTAAEMEQITTFTVLSLAAQEYFWNEKSTVADLKIRVERELRYGLFKKAGNSLDVRNLVFLGGDDLERIINARIDLGLTGKLAGLMTGFRDKTLGATYSAIFDDLAAKLGDKAVGAVGDVPLNLDGDVLDSLELNALLTVKAVRSEGDGMCGEHSLFIPTDGPLVGVSEGNGRNKILSAITDQAEDDEARRLYLLNSEHMESKKFIDLITREVAKIRKTDAGQADRLQEQLEAYQKFSVEIRGKAEEDVNASRIALIKRVTQLPSLAGVLAAFNVILNTQGDLKVLLSTEKGKRALRNIVGELIGLRKINATLDGLLATIDDQIRQLDIEASTAESGAQAKHALKIAETTKKRVDTRKSLTEFCERNNDFAKQYVASKKKPETESKKALEDLKGTNIPLFQELEKLIAEAEKAIEACKSIPSDLAVRDAKMIEKYLLIGDTLKGFLNETMLPGSGHANAFTVEGIATKMGFITDFCQSMCELAQSNATKDSIVELMNEFQRMPELINREICNGLVIKALEIVEGLPEVPAELRPDALSAEMTGLALSDGELRGWLPCDAIYTQLWAITNNVNVFVFAGNEGGMTPPLDVILRLKDRPYNQTTVTYPLGTKGKNLATVILTSPTAKNIFMNKGPGHYDKFILPTDYAAMAAALRHLEWTSLRTRYAAYPA